MSHLYRVVVFDENKKVLISKVVTADAETAASITLRIVAVIEMYHARFTVHVTDYIHDNMSVMDFLDFLSTALEEMSLRGGK